VSDERARWDAYLWEPGGLVLRNRWGERDLLALDIREHRETDRRETEIKHGRAEIPRPSMSVRSRQGKAPADTFRSGGPCALKSCEGVGW